MKDKYLEIAKTAHPRVLALINDKLSNSFSEYDYKLVLRKSGTKYWKGINPTSWAEIFQENHPTLGQIIKYEGMEKAVLICTHVFTESKILNSTDRQLIISFLLSPGDDGYQSFTILDLKLCLHLGRLGQLTKSYGDLKISDITGLDGWFETFFKMRIKQNKIFRNLTNRNGIDKDPIKESELTISKNAIPAPASFIKAREDLEKKFNLERSEESKAFHSNKYPTIESYINESEENRFKAHELENLWTQEYNSNQIGMKIEQYMGIKWERYLYEQRNKLKP